MFILIGNFLIFALTGGYGGGGGGLVITFA